MNIQLSKIELVKTIFDIDNKELINKVAKFIQKEKSDFWPDLNSKQLNEIKLGIQELDAGKRVAFTAVLKKITK